MTGEDIRRHRKALGMTIQEFAYQVGVDEYSVRRWERGDYRPSRLALKAIIQTLRELHSVEKQIDEQSED